MSSVDLPDQSVRRHAASDRVVHWLFAVSVLILLGTGFLPIVGLNFEWVTWHWSTGLALTAVLGVHVWRAWLKTKFRSIWFGFSDAKLALVSLKDGSQKPGKYSPAQKMMHFGVTVLVLGTLVTGLVMMVKVDTPFWERNPYLLDGSTWGVVYLVHGLSSMLLITTVMLHIYFALRPEKRLYLRSMFSGEISRTELADHHDQEKWSGDQ
ncbi:MAG: cytochrome b/b6 domain-containing protein [Pseudomonadales bacterium]|nr:cytochrome b/b6 domain-containing protein [Pseudomonadales bacterium]